MRTSSALTVLAAISSSIAAPAPVTEADDSIEIVPAVPMKQAAVAPRGSNQAVNYDDDDIVNLALTLEYIGRAFYQQGLTNYTQEDFCNCGFDPSVYENLQKIYGDEQSHVALLQAFMGNDAVAESTYQFPSYDPVTFIQFAAILEGVAVSAFSGAATAVYQDAVKRIAARRMAEQAAASVQEDYNDYVYILDAILGVEAQHDGYLRYVAGYPSFPNPFATPIPLNASYSIAVESIKTMPAQNQGKLPFVAYPPITLAPQENVYIPGYTNVTFLNAYANAVDSGRVKPGDPIWAIFLSGIGEYVAETTLLPNNRDLTAVIPAEGFNGGGPTDMPPSGQVYVILFDGFDDTNAQSQGGKIMSGVSANLQDGDDGIVAGVGIIEVSAPPPGYPQAPGGYPPQAQGGRKAGTSSAEESGNKAASA